jgi:anti-sigma regulatory factor (Ser/Thr protein kinase)
MKRIHEEATMSSDLDLASGAAATRQQFRRGLSAPAAGRKFARDFLADIGAGQRCQQVAELLVSELIANSVVHARSTARLSVSVTGETARMEVSDDGPGWPELRQPDDQGGYGLWMINWLARKWGVSGTGGQGKTVWFTLPLSDSSEAGSGQAATSG